MKKKILAIMMAILVAGTMLLAGCGSDNGESASKDGAVTGDSTTTDGTDADSAADGIDYDYYEDTVYGEMLNNYYSLITICMRSQEDPSVYDSDAYTELCEMPGGGGVADVANYDSDPLAHLGYRLEDYSGDGIPELVIADIEDAEADPDFPFTQNIYAMLTAVDGEPMLVFEGWSRNRNYMLNDKTFANNGSAGAASSGFGAFTLSEDGTEQIWTDWYFSDFIDEEMTEIGYFHNKTGEWNKETSEQLDVSSDDFYAIDEKYASEACVIELTPFADFDFAAGEGGAGKSAGAVSDSGNADDVGVLMYAEWAENCIEDYLDYSIVETADAGAAPTQVMLIALETVNDFELFEMQNFEYDYETGASYDAQVLYESDIVTPAKPVLLKMSFIGSIPQYGISYKDANGRERSFYIEESGYDGSVILTEM